MDNLLKERLDEHIQMFNDMQADDNLKVCIIKLADEISKCLKNNGRVMLCGNGGSAADAQHIAAEFIGRFQKNRKAYDVEAMNVNTSTITSVGNDYGFDYIFSRQIEAKGRKGDVLIGISTSGKSLNVLNALKIANRKNMVVVMLMGDYDNFSLNELCDYVIRVPSKITARIQEGHIFIGHMVAEIVENSLSDC